LDSIDWQDAKFLGDGALRHVEHYVEKACEQAQEGIFEGFTTKVVNVPYLNVSEVAGRLAESRSVGFAWFERGDGQTQFSLRSRGDGPDVSLLAKKYGGGGHKNAAGFQLSLKQGRDLVDRILGR
jgi:nanoRNase/pAp phosphatase (c-di-AMP/oligoRNAs hydrolase)